MTETMACRRPERNEGGSGAAAASRSRPATSARSARSRSTRSYASATIPPNTPVGGVHVIDDWETCTSVDLRLLCNSESIRERKALCGWLEGEHTHASINWSLTRGQHGAHEAATRDPHLSRRVRGTERVRTELRGNRATVQL